MNERIQELALQAHVNVITTEGMEYIVDGCYIISPNKLNKFAELIIRECVRIIGHGMDHTDYPDDIEKSMVELKAQKWCRDAIKEHFGVKP